MAYGQFTSKKVDQSVFIDEDLNPVVINHPPPPQPVNQTPPPPQQKVTLEEGEITVDNSLENIQVKYRCWSTPCEITKNRCWPTFSRKNL